jgi:hypothetical protein
MIMLHRLSHHSELHGRPDADNPGVGASPAESGRGKHRRTPSVAAADDWAEDWAMVTPRSRDTPQRSLRDRQSAGSRKPWWQV